MHLYGMLRCASDGTVGQHKQAISFFHKSMIQSPGNPGLWEGLSVALMRDAHITATQLKARSH